MTERAIYHEGRDIGHVYRQDNPLFPWAATSQSGTWWATTYEGAVARLMQMWAQRDDLRNRKVKQ